MINRDMMCVRQNLRRNGNLYHQNFILLIILYRTTLEAMWIPSKRDMIPPRSTKIEITPLVVKRHATLRIPVDATMFEKARVARRMVNKCCRCHVRIFSLVLIQKISSMQYSKWKKYMCRCF